jgi:HAD superfamily hydrolase (TIGR01509 family)
MNTPAFDTIVFDLGGVMVELSGIQTMAARSNRGPEEWWPRWLASASVRRFESGQITAEQFAGQIIAEFELPIDEAHFLREFAAWPKRPYPGAPELLNSLRPSYRLASLSNTNALHWQIMMNEMDLLQRFDFNFPSFQTGLLKPDQETFTHVVEQLACPAERILFLDDNQINVDGAAAVGVVAYRARGLEDAIMILRELGIQGPGQGSAAAPQVARGDP